MVDKWLVAQLKLNVSSEATAGIYNICTGHLSHVARHLHTQGFACSINITVWLVAIRKSDAIYCIAQTLAVGNCSGLLPKNILAETIGRLVCSIQL